VVVSVDDPNAAQPIPAFDVGVAPAIGSMVTLLWAEPDDSQSTATNAPAIAMFDHASDALAFSSRAVSALALPIGFVLAAVALLILCVVAAFAMRWAALVVSPALIVLVFFARSRRRLVETSLRNAGTAAKAQITRDRRELATRLRALSELRIRTKADLAPWMEEANALRAWLATPRSLVQPPELTAYFRDADRRLSEPRLAAEHQRFVTRYIAELES
jgi:hypothetical protein